MQYFSITLNALHNSYCSPILLSIVNSITSKQFSTGAAYTHYQQYWINSHSNHEDMAAAQRCFVKTDNLSIADSEVYVDTE